MTEENVNGGTRIGSMILDHVIMTFIITILYIPGIILGISKAFQISHEQTSPTLFGDTFYYSLFCFAVYFCKDSFGGRSIAKRILKLQIVDIKTGQPASPIKCFIRNIFCIIWPVEVIVALTNSSSRIGDRVAGTKLIKFNPVLEQPRQNNYGQILISLVLAYCLMLLICFPFILLQKTFSEQKVKFVESSYNEEESNNIEKYIADTLGDKMTADIRIYEKIQNENLKYVSIIFNLKEDYLDDDDFESLKSGTIPLLFDKLPSQTFIGNIQYVYKNGGNMRMRTAYLDPSDPSLTFNLKYKKLFRFSKHIPKFIKIAGNTMLAEEYYESDKLKLKYSDSVVQGENIYFFQAFDEQGNIDSTGFYDNEGHGTGAWTKYSKNNKIVYEINMKKGNYDGSYKFYHPNGQLWLEMIYKNGKAWEVIGNYGEAGEPQSKGTLKNGNGTIIYHDKDGKETKTEEYKNGESIGK